MNHGCWIVSKIIYARYDDKDNFIEQDTYVNKELLSGDANELYDKKISKYQFDKYGNWIKGTLYDVNVKNDTVPMGLTEREIKYY